MESSATGVDRRPKALSLDLFGTIVFFDSTRVPRRKVGAEDRVVTVAGLDELLSTAAPGVSTAAFLDKLTDVGVALGREKQESLCEMPTATRFVRALRDLGAHGALETVAEVMTERHMATLAAAVVCPPERAELLAELALRYPLALVSNFDHGKTARALLDRFDLTRNFRSICISAEIGRIKPSSEIFLAACRDLGRLPVDVLHIGDSATADVHGAIDAGMRALWIGSGAGAPALATLSDLAQLPGWLAERYA